MKFGEIKPGTIFTSSLGERWVKIQDEPFYSEGCYINNALRLDSIHKSYFHNEDKIYLKKSIL